MEAKCPFCDNGCDKCDGGKIDVRHAEGALFTIKCMNIMCGFENGTRVVAPNLPPLPPEGLDERGNVLECILCEHAAEWDLIGWSGPSKPLDGE